MSVTNLPRTCFNDLRQTSVYALPGRTFKTIKVRLRQIGRSYALTTKKIWKLSNKNSWQCFKTCRQNSDNITGWGRNDAFGFRLYLRNIPYLINAFWALYAFRPFSEVLWPAALYQQGPPGATQDGRGDKRTEHREATTASLHIAAWTQGPTSIICPFRSVDEVQRLSCGAQPAVFA